MNKEKWQRSLDEAVEELLVKGNLKVPIESFQIGVLEEKLVLEIQNKFGIKLEQAIIMWDKQGVLHIKEERKGRYKQALKTEEVRQIVNVLADTKTMVCLDSEHKNNIIFWFNDANDEKKANKIVVAMNYVLKKVGVVNYVVTASKVDSSDINKGKKLR